MNRDMDKDRLIELVGRLCDQEISEEDLAELEAMLKESQQARELYHLTVALHRDLESCEIGRGQGASRPSNVRPNKTAASVLPLTRFALVASILLAVSLIVYLAFRGDNETPEPPEATMVATVTDLIDVQWARGQSGINIGDNLPSQRLKVEAGTVLLTYKHGVVVTIEGPADFELQSKDHAVLHEGQLVAYVPDGAEGFQVSTQSAEVVDLGTEFGVTHRSDGGSDVIVFDGEVELAAKNSPKSTGRRVVAGLAFRVDVDGTTHQEEFRQSRFENARSIIRSRKVIRESFPRDNRFPGEAMNGWTSPWSVVPNNLTIDKSATGIQTEESLAPGTRNYLTVLGGSGAKGEPGSLRLSRSFASFDEFDVTQPYTVEFLIRLECDPTKIEGIRVFGVQTPVDPDDDRAIWQVSTVRSNEELSWRLYHPRDGVRMSDTLRLVEYQSYRFLIEVHPQKRRWRASISDGTHSIWNTLKNGDPLRLSRDGDPKNNVLGWELTVDPDTQLRFSLDAIRIQNRPSATANLESGVE